MREILFRGKSNWTYGNVKAGDWLYGMTISRHSYNDEEITSYYIGGGINTIDGKTLGQYTGLTDTNGKKIFEGDIVKFGKNIYQIIFDVGSFALYDEQGNMISKIGGHNDHCYSFMDLYIECCWEERNAYDIEVIGNIHDNPELLKGGD